jgi:hypothetical protein
VTDVRFPNEARLIEEYDGVLVRVVRAETHYDGALGRMVREHISETAVKEQRADFRIENDGPLDELKAKGARLMETILNGGTARRLKAERGNV